MVKKLFFFSSISCRTSSSHSSSTTTTTTNEEQPNGGHIEVQEIQKSSVYDVIMRRIGAILIACTSFKRLDHQEGTYLKQIREHVDIKKCIDDISNCLYRNEQLCLQYKKEFFKYEYLWTTDLLQMFYTFLIKDAWKKEKQQQKIEDIRPSSSTSSRPSSCNSSRPSTCISSRPTNATNRNFPQQKTNIEPMSRKKSIMMASLDPTRIRTRNTNTTNCRNKNFM
jgi:hypothetical protein